MPLEAALIGLTAGVLAGVMGVGGGLIMIPGLVLISGVGQHTAQGVSLAVIVVTGLVGSFINLRQHQVRLGIVAAVAPAAAISAFLAGALATRLEADWLTRVFGLFLLAVGIRMFVWGNHTIGGNARSPHPPGGSEAKRLYLGGRPDKAGR
ncbi:MAG: sulfite exporter TauE/SafE family protein [Chloroflexi bacterium]|nr:sulfite exporter TauE/SafE family protein [Chloroflexota bacterium]